MEDDFLNRFFKDLNNEIPNPEYINLLKKEISEIDAEKVEKLIKEHF